MKKTIAAIVCIVLLTTSALAFGGGTGDAVYSNVTTFADGLTYSHDISKNSSGKLVDSFTLTDDLYNDVYPIVLANDTIYGGMTMTQIISYAESLGYNVVAAVNADFGYWSTRISCGMVVEDGIYKTSPEGNNVIGFSADGAYVSYWPKVNITLANSTGGTSVTTTHLNKSRASDGLYLYSEHFSTVSTRTSGEGRFVRFKVLEGEMTLGGTMSLEVTEVIEDKTAVPIGKGNLILTADEAKTLNTDLDGFAVGDKITLTVSCSDEKLISADWVSGCGNILVRDGELFDTEHWNSSIAGANPRTAIGIKPDGSVVYYVIDGRSDASAGASLSQLAADMISMGCVDVVNMDGGGSTAMALREPGGKGLTIVNTPSDGSLRSVCSYILLVTDTKSDGSAARLFLGEDGHMILAGSSMNISATATDAGLHTASVGDYTVSAASGTVSGGVYTAPDTAVKDTITLSSGGMTGTGTIHVLSAPDKITVRDSSSGSIVKSLSLERGTSVSLSATSSCLGRSLIADTDAYEYAVTGNIGEITDDGVFTASGDYGAEGKITVTLAGFSAEIPVSIGFEFSDTASHWARSYIKTLYENSIVSGTTATTFSPDNAMRRCDFVLMLWRAAGQPEVTGSSAFTDVPADAYYAKAVAWAASAGIAQGSEGRFMPLDTLTREQGVTFLYRALSALKVNYTDGDSTNLESFTDRAELSDWAVVPAATLVKMGVLEGSGGALTPKASLTRAQMAKLLCVTVFEQQAK